MDLVKLSVILMPSARQYLRNMKVTTSDYVIGISLGIVLVIIAYVTAVKSKNK
jgi:hypothetical protein